VAEAAALVVVASAVAAVASAVAALLAAGNQASMPDKPVDIADMTGRNKTAPGLVARSLIARRLIERNDSHDIIE
jgi:hypothetical protein